MSRCDLNVTLPVFNEAACLKKSVSQVVRMLERLSDSFEVLVVDNGSSDSTPHIAKELAEADARVRFDRLVSAGRGRALKLGWRSSSARIVSYMDIDLSTDLSCFPALIKPLQDGVADFAIGSRMKSGAFVRRRWHREWISRSYVGLLQRSLGGRLSDYQCGFKAAVRDAALTVLPQVRNGNWFFDTELLFRASRMGYCVAEVPVRWEEDRDSRVRILPTIAEDLRGIWRLKREFGDRSPKV